MKILVICLITVVILSGTFIYAGGNIMVIVYALPIEMVIIGGSAVSATMISRDKKILTEIVSLTKRASKGSRYHKEHYTSLLAMLYALLRIAKIEGVVALEKHIDNFDESDIISKYTNIAKEEAVDPFMRDILRAMTLQLTDPHRLEDMMDRAIEKIRHERMIVAHTLYTVADSLPALGIVAAVLGVIRAMGSVDEPPEILAGMVGSALVGTFLGVFLAYVIAAPIAGRVEHIIEEEMTLFTVVRDALVAHANGIPAHVAVEMARGAVPSHDQPSYDEVEESLRHSRGGGEAKAA
ncbi:MAG: motility-associated protein [Pseudomonadota bacterium]